MSRAAFRSLALLLGVSLLLSGCESLSATAGSIRERLGAREETRGRAYAAAPRDVYDALKAAATQMGYRQTRGGPAQGEFEAVSAVSPGDRHGTARQIVLKARLGPGPEGRGTLLTVGLSEVIEEDSSQRPGMATRTALRDTPQHEVLFRRVAEILGERITATGR